MPDRKKVLVIDDNPDIIENTRIVLESEGYEVHSAPDGDSGLEIVKKLKPNLIILDVMMDKHTDGFDLCYDLKHDETCRKIPIMMVTAVTDKTGFKFSPETDGEYLQADEYVSKPIPVPELLSRVNKMIG